LLLRAIFCVKQLQQMFCGSTKTNQIWEQGLFEPKQKAKNLLQRSTNKEKYFHDMHKR